MLRKQKRSRRAKREEFTVKESGTFAKRNALKREHDNDWKREVRYV